MRYGLALGIVAGTCLAQTPAPSEPVAKPKPVENVRPKNRPIAPVLVAPSPIVVPLCTVFDGNPVMVFDGDKVTITFPKKEETPPEK